MRRQFFVWGLLLPLLLLGPFALAESVPPTKEEAAKAHFRKGAELYRQADYSGAWLEFTTAYQLVPRVQLLFNMARCEVRLGRSRDALEHFRAYLEAVPSDPDAEGIRKEMVDLRVQVVEQQRREAAPGAVDATPPLPQGKTTRSWPLYGTIAGAGTVILAVAMAATLGSVGSQYNDLQQNCAPNCPQDRVSRLEQQATAGYVLLGLTLAGAATTAVLLTLELRRGKEGRLQPVGQGGPRPLGMSWRF